MPRSALFLENAGEGADDVVVVSGDDFGQKFDDGDVGTEAGPDGAEFETDGAAADDHEFLRNGREGDGVIAGDDGLAVELHERQLDGGGAGGDDDVFGGDRLVADAEGGRGSERRSSRDDGDLAGLGELGDTADELGDDVVFLFEKGREIEFDAGELDAVGGGVGFGEDELLGGMKQGFTRDAAHVQASAAEGGAFLDQRDLEAELGGAEGADVAAGAGADDDQIEGLGRHEDWELRVWS